MSLLHEDACACEICVAWRAAMRQKVDPLMNKEIKATNRLIPVEQAIAQLLEAKEMYIDRIADIDLQLKDLRDF
jgi:hypothetical protein